MSDVKHPQRGEIVYLLPKALAQTVISTAGDKNRPWLVVSRERNGRLIVALVSSAKEGYEDKRRWVQLHKRQSGLKYDAFIKCDELFTVRLTDVLFATPRRRFLPSGTRTMQDVNEAIRFVLDLNDDRPRLL